MPVLTRIPSPVFQNFTAFLGSLVCAIAKLPGWAFGHHPVQEGRRCNRVDRHNEPVVPVIGFVEGATGDAGGTGTAIFNPEVVTLLGIAVELSDAVVVVPGIAGLIAECS